MKEYKLDVVFIMHDALARFNKNYEYIYDHEETDENVATIARLATAKYDQMMEIDGMFRDFVSSFSEYRGDYITSDRECAAIMIAFQDILLEQL